MKISKIVLAFVFAGALAVPAVACDVCAVYAAATARGDAGNGFFGGVAGQFTHFGTMQLDGHKEPNPTGQYMNSSVSQLFAGYNFSDQLGVQVNVPFIYRSFKRPEGFAIDKGTESGLGDVSLLGTFTPVRYEKMHRTFIWRLLGGVKFPTGSSRRIAEELNEIEIPGAPESGIHGHDLTLGSGSIDGIIGTGIFFRERRFFFSANTQYALRSSGDYDYRFANDFTWAGGPGAYLLFDDYYTLSLQAVISGEHKGPDSFEEISADDTGITAVYVGPQLTVTWKEHLSAEVGVDFPVSIKNTALQTVPDYRVRAGLTWHF
jgi:hypothetical protein